MLSQGCFTEACLTLPFFVSFSSLERASPHVIFAELVEALWQRTWWFQIMDLMHRLDSTDEGSLHPDILSDNIHDA